MFDALKAHVVMRNGERSHRRHVRFGGRRPSRPLHALNAAAVRSIAPAELMRLRGVVTVPPGFLSSRRASAPAVQGDADSGGQGAGAHSQGAFAEPGRRGQRRPGPWRPDDDRRCTHAPQKMTQPWSPLSQATRRCSRGRTQPTMPRAPPYGGPWTTSHLHLALRLARVPRRRWVGPSSASPPPMCARTRRLRLEACAARPRAAPPATEDRRAHTARGRVVSPPPQWSLPLLAVHTPHRGSMHRGSQRPNVRATAPERYPRRLERALPPPAAQSRGPGASVETSAAASGPAPPVQEQSESPTPRLGTDYPEGPDCAVQHVLDPTARPLQADARLRRVD